jgi:hypothetical protein
MLNRFREWISYLKTMNESISVYARNHLSFWGAAPRSSDLSPRFLSVGELTTLAYSAAIANKETLHKRIFMPIKPFAPAPWPVKCCENPWSDVSMRAFI